MMRKLTRLSAVLFACLAVLAALWPCRSAAASLAGSACLQAPEQSSPSPFDSVRFRRLTIEEGLSQSSVYSILQDHEGYIWIGTADGLNRYDGYQFTIYKHAADDPATLTDSYIWPLCEDGAGNLWVGTLNGLNRYDRETDSFERYQHDAGNPDSLSGTWISALCEDPSGRIWVATVDGGLNLLDPASGAFAHYRHDPAEPSSLAGDAVRALLVDREGTLWVGTENGLDRFDRASGTFVHYRYERNDPSSLSANTVLALHEDRTGTLWVGTEGGGLNRFDRARGTFAHYRQSPAGGLDSEPSLSDDVVWSILDDGAGSLWVGTQSGLDRLDPSREAVTHYRRDPGDPYSLSDDFCFHLYEDRAGNIWVGTMAGGVSLYSPAANKFGLLQQGPAEAGELSDSIVLAVCEDLEGDLWIGTMNGGLNRVDARTGAVTVYRHDPLDTGSLSSDEVRALLVDRAGTLWVGTNYGGLDRFEPETQTFAHYRNDPDDPNSLNENRVMRLFEDRLGNLWVATWTGLLDRFDRETGIFHHYRHEPGDPHSLAHNKVRAFYESRDGRLWIGTLGGISVWDPASDRFTNYVHDPSNPQSLSQDMLSCLYEDGEGAIWAGTLGGGLNHLDPATGAFRHYTERDGLPNDTVCGILGDASGNLWLSTNVGLSCFDPRAETFRNYDVQDGLQSNEFSGGSCFQNARGEMFFGGVGGLNAFHPAQVRDNPSPPPIVITGFDLFYERVRSRVAADEHIRLAYTDNSIAFEFAALDYAAPEKNQYAYMLEGVDRDWVEAGTRRYATYPNLGWGEYTFRVRGANGDGEWNEAGIAVHITVTPPFWATGWFRALVALLVVAGVVGGYRLRVRSMVTRNRALEKEVALRTSELRQEMEQRRQAEAALRRSETEQAIVAERNRLARELHDAVTQTLFSASLIAEALPPLWERDPAQGQQLLLELRQMNRGALAEMRSLLLELRPGALVETSLADLLRQLAEAAGGRKGLPVTVQVEGECELPEEVHVALYRIAQEALNNVVKHTEATEVEVRLRCQAGGPGPQVELSVRDDGCGFDPGATAQGHLGLGIMQERAAAVGARLRIESAPGAGTLLSVAWPAAEGEEAR